MNKGALYTSESIIHLEAGRLLTCFRLGRARTILMTDRMSQARPPTARRSFIWANTYQTGRWVSLLEGVTALIDARFRKADPLCRRDQRHQ